MGLRDLMREQVSARSICKHCDKPIERRGPIWHAAGETIGSDICIKTHRAEHAPIKGKV